MRPEHEQTSYFVLDSKDQPNAKYVLFLTVNGATNQFAVDGLTYDDEPGIVGFIRKNGLTETVLRFRVESEYVLVSQNCLEAVTRDDMRRHTIAAIPKQAERGQEYSREIQRAQQRYSEGSTDTNPTNDSEFSDYLRRMLGDDGEKL